MLTEDQIRTFHQTGHLTVADVFTTDEIDEALDDLSLWSEEFLSSLPEAQRAWFLEAGCEKPLLRKLDHPVHYRDVFRQMASHPNLVSMVHQLIGTGVSVFFSQVFMKPPEVGGPKPIHQDNFYFGPDDFDATLTVWIALDDATVDNGCLFYSDAPAHDIFPHEAPPGEPFNLQILSEHARHLRMRPAPVRRGGISFHHGNTPHQSSANRSEHSRRAAAFHYLRQSARLVSPALPYDASFAVAIG
jgi:ectoine hydroxylase-related dioxygenase (phytanoyl-CoA dioxygenase family)